VVDSTDLAAAKRLLHAAKEAGFVFSGSRRVKMLPCSGCARAHRPNDARTVPTPYTDLLLNQPCPARSLHPVSDVPMEIRKRRRALAELRCRVPIAVISDDDVPGQQRKLAALGLATVGAELVVPGGDLRYRWQW
jgi:hypothetical protein